MTFSSAKNLTHDIITLCKRDRKVVLVPLVFVVLSIAALLVLFFTIAGPLAPFIYPLF